MKIMIDTNILISAILFPSQNMNKLINTIADNHTIVLASYIIDELKEVINRKFPQKYKYLDSFLMELPYEFAYTPDIIDITKYPYIRDKKDLPVLVSAIIEEVDILITGDKDFSELDIEKPEILTPKEFLEKYS